MPEHVIRAAYSDQTIRVYQAHRPEIAKPALKAGRFVPPFSFERMSWIKPSFNWMTRRYGRESARSELRAGDLASAIPPSPSCCARSPLMLQRLQFHFESFASP
jgi:hypothetical protein